MSLRRVVDALVRSTDSLIRAVDSDDLIGLATALETRKRAYEDLRQQSLPLNQDERAAIAMLGDRDRVLEVKARERIEAARVEVAQIRQARRSLRTSRDETKPRFVSRHA